MEKRRGVLRDACTVCGCYNRINKEEWTGEIDLSEICRFLYKSNTLSIDDAYTRFGCSGCCALFLFENFAAGIRVDRLGIRHLY